MSWQSIYPVDVVFWTGRTAKLQVWFSTQRSLFHWYWHRFAASTDCPLEVCKEKTTSSLTDNRKLYVEKRGNYALTQKKIFSLFFTGIPDKDPFRKSAFKAGFHSRRSRSRSRKRSHKLDGIRVGRIRTFPFLPIPFTTLSLMIPVKTRLSKSEAKAEEPTKLQQRNFHLIVNDGDKSRISILLLTVRRFSSFDLILWLWLPLTTLSLVKTSAI